MCNQTQSFTVYYQSLLLLGFLTIDKARLEIFYYNEVILEQFVQITITLKKLLILFNFFDSI